MDVFALVQRNIHAQVENIGACVHTPVEHHERNVEKARAEEK